MDYLKIYNNLMKTMVAIKRERKDLKKKGSYFERHHITPLSMGGDKSYALASDNIVLLTAREHYIAHRLLWLIYRTREMGFAFHKMVFSQSPLQERRFDSRAYEAAKLALSQCQRGENNPMWGKSPWQKGKVSQNKGKKLGERPYLTGENNPSKSKEAREKISKALKGLKKPPISEEHKNKISERTKGEKNPKFGKYKSHFTDFPVFQYSSSDGSFVKEWKNCIEAANHYGISRRSIYSCIRGKLQSYKGSIWFNDTMGEKIKISSYLKLLKEIVELDDHGKIINSWGSLGKFGSDIGISSSLACQYIKTGKKIKGRIFRYKEA